MGNPVAFEASAELRETRGFISMTIIRPFSGLTANWMFEPPVSTPISRITASAASRMIWYSLSVRVIAGATVIESPVWTPIGSKFSIEQMMTALSLRVAHHLQLVFLPAEHRLLDQHLAARALLQAPGDLAVELLGVPGDGRARAAQRERRPQDHRVADAGLGRHLRLDRPRLFQGVGVAGERHVEADLLHRLLEQLAVLGLLDRRDLRADQLDAVGGEHAGLVQLERQVERRLPAQRRQERVGALALDDRW